MSDEKDKKTDKVSEKTEKIKNVDVDALLTEVTGAIATGKPAAKKRGPTSAAPEPPAKAATARPAPAPAAAKEARTVRIRQVKSGICTPVDQKQTLFGLGLRRIRQEVVRPDTPSVRGQILKVRHLVEVIGE